ncbi:hypothetical protein [Paramicrobacterium humi]|uniref:hypothetical protein n=1 Tax=Paramicrobacterium humi TaxID=640635 RepID=UPI000B8082CA|nr:hypothetical protein [Microbacterium humi]
MRKLFVGGGLTAVAAGALILGAAIPAQAAQPGQMTVSTTRVASGGSITVSGTGCVANGKPVSVDVGVSGGQWGDHLDTVTPKADGTWSTTASLSAYQDGALAIVATCDLYTSSFRYDAKSIFLGDSSKWYDTNSAFSKTQLDSFFAKAKSDAGLKLSTSTVTPGESLTVSVPDDAGYFSGESVEVWAHSTPVLLGTLTAAADGSVSGTVAIPSTLPAGSHTVYLIGVMSGTSTSVPLAVSTSASDISGSVPGAATDLVAQTTPSNGFAIAGIAAGVAGLGLLAAAGVQFARRRREQQNH